MKRFLLIAGGVYYPRMGTGDWVGAFETYEEAEKHAKENPTDWYNIIDLIAWVG
jgi:hypothetical protein